MCAIKTRSVALYNGVFKRWNVIITWILMVQPARLMAVCRCYDCTGPGLAGRIIEKSGNVVDE